MSYEEENAFELLLKSIDIIFNIVNETLKSLTVGELEVTLQKLEDIYGRIDDEIDLRKNIQIQQTQQQHNSNNNNNNSNNNNNFNQL